MRAWMVAGLLAASPCWVGPAAAADFNHTLRMLGGFCISATSERCYARAFATVDTDRNGGLSIDEARAAQRQLEDWSAAHAAELDPADRNGLLLGLVAVQIAGLDSLFASFDADHDGEVTESELSADVRFDHRPVSELVRDRRAVDWERLLGRLGLGAGLVRSLTPPAEG